MWKMAKMGYPQNFWNTCLRLQIEEVHYVSVNMYSTNSTVSFLILLNTDVEGVYTVTYWCVHMTHVVRVPAIPDDANSLCRRKCESEGTLKKRSRMHRGFRLRWFLQVHPRLCNRTLSYVTIILWTNKNPCLNKETESNTTSGKRSLHLSLKNCYLRNGNNVVSECSPLGAQSV